MRNKNVKRWYKSFRRASAMKTNYWDGKGEPKVGQFARVFIHPAYTTTASKSLSQFIGLDVEIINKFYYEEQLITVIHNLKCGHKSISGWNNFLTAIKSEREIAIEEIEKVLSDYTFNIESLAGYLYDAGYRKVEGAQ